jgi:hypothetical protein
MLTKLELEVVDVHLPALSPVSSQLISLELKQCRLRTGAAASTTVFEAGWDSLIRLSLERSAIDAPLGGVSMPQLQDLDIGHVRVERGPPDIVRIDPFLRGCPSCSSVQFEAQYLRGSDIHSSCKQLTSLRDVSLVWDALSLFEDNPWPAQPLPLVELPPSVTCLKCFSREIKYLEGADILMELDLPTMLGMAAGCIAAGVPLQTLTIDFCATYVAVVDGHEVQPTAEEHALFYSPVSAALHGLKNLDLAGESAEYGTGCSVQAMNTIVASAPDLRTLAFKFSDERMHGNEEVVQVQCRGLTSLLIAYRLDLMLSQASSTLVALKLQNAACLQKCTLLVEGEPGVSMGNVVRVSFDTPVSAEVAADACGDDQHHGLHIRVSGLSGRATGALQQAPVRQADVSFEWCTCSPAGADVKMDWKIAVQ